MVEDNDKIQAKYKSRKIFWFCIGLFILVIGAICNPWSIGELVARYHYREDDVLGVTIACIVIILAGLLIILLSGFLARKLFLRFSGIQVLIYLVCCLLFVGLFLEIGLRVITSTPLTAVSTEAKFRYFDYHLFVPNRDGEFANYLSPLEKEIRLINKDDNIKFQDLSLYYATRPVPASKPLKEADTIIWFFGGSTMEDIYVSADNSIANTAIKRLNAAGLKVRGYNLGVNCFQSSNEIIKFSDLLRRMPAEQLPDYAVFYDGYNECSCGLHGGAGSMDLGRSAQLRALIVPENARTLVNSFLSLCAEYSLVVRKIILPPIQKNIFGPPFKHVSKNNPEYKSYKLGDAKNASHIYAKNQEMINVIGKNFNVKTLSILQPMAFTKKNPGKRETDVLSADGFGKVYSRAVYSGILSNMNNHKYFIDATHIFDNIADDVFVDLGHTKEFGSKFIGSFIAEKLLANLNYDRKLPTSNK